MDEKISRKLWAKKDNSGKMLNRYETNKGHYEQTSGNYRIFIDGEMSGV